MEVFNSLHEFMLHTKTLAYGLIGFGLAALAAYWCFLSEKDEKIRKF